VEQDSHGLAVLMAMDNSEKWRTAMGVNPQARLAEMEADLARARGFTKKTKLFLILTILLIPLSFALAVAAVVAAGIAGLDLDDSVPTLFAYVFVAGLFGAPVVLLIHWSGKQGLPSRERKVTELRTQLDAYNAFLADPQGGALWEQALRDHPALRAGIPANA
jgi:type IV secretory pathway VirB2 component (pilin)